MRKICLMCSAALLLFALAACGCDDGGDVVFVQTGERPVFSVGVEGPDGGGGVQNADGTAMKQGDSYGFDAKKVGWPMEITACRGLHAADPIASVTIPKAPPEGERWFVYFWNGRLSYGTDWPLER